MPCRLCLVLHSLLKQIAWGCLPDDKIDPHVRKVRSGMNFTLCLVFGSLLKQIAWGCLPDEKIDTHVGKVCSGLTCSLWFVFGSLLKQKAGVDLVSNNLVFFPLIF